jgi:hypothetical protein
MWIFSDSGFLSLTQHPSDAELLLVEARSREEIGPVVVALDEIAGQQHDLIPANEQGCRVATVARRDDVARVVARLVAGINYSRFTQSVHFDFGSDPNFILCVGDGGLQVARIKPDVIG